MRAFQKYAKKLTSMLVAVPVLAATVFAACSCSAGAGKSDKLRIVTTIFPEYDWVREIAGERLSDTELTLLCDNGVDMHSLGHYKDLFVRRFRICGRRVR